MSNTVQSALVICVAALIATSLAFNIHFLAGTYGDFINGHDKQRKTKDRQCDTQLRAFGYEEPTQTDANPYNDKKKRREDVCLQYRSTIATEYSAEYAERTYYFTIANITLVALAALAAAMAAGYTGRQARVAQSALAITEATARQQLRAYIGFDTATMKDFMSIDPKLTIFVKNYGSTPAHNVRFRIGIQIIEAVRENSAIIELGEWNEYGVAQPSANINMHADGRRLNRDIPNGIKNSIKDGRIVLVVDGDLTYFDVFKCSRRTTFRIAYGGSYHRGGDGDLYVCQNGNQAT